eukprot:9447185-Alexandrium_andersonii.AAC.1
MSASLVGSEMCIRDSALCLWVFGLRTAVSSPIPLGSWPPLDSCATWGGCLLYTSDAADDM